jgi:hypothetical protein
METEKRIYGLLNRRQGIEGLDYLMTLVNKE